MFLRRKFSTKNYDLAVIGGGPGGYVASIKAAQLGMNTVCIDNRPRLGGTCLNVGCIPSKLLLKVAHKYTDLLNAKKFGVSCQNPSYNWTEVQRLKGQTIDILGGGINHLFNKNKVERILGTVSFHNMETLMVKGPEGDPYPVKAKNYVIATGSKPKLIENVHVDEKVICTSTGILALQKVPKKMIVIGAGVIGLELGSVFRSLGSEVTFVEYAPNILPGMDQDIVREYHSYLKKEGYKFALNSLVLKAEVSPTTKEAVIYLQDKSTSKTSVLTGDVCLVATGRVPNTTGLKLENVGVTLDAQKRIKVNNRFHTGIGNIYAIGDVIDGPMLAHKAEEEGMAVAELLSGHDFAINYDAVPSVVYTEPEIAFVGKTEAQLKNLGIPYKSGIFPMSANSRSIASLESKPGLIKILAHRDTDRVLGAHIISTNAGEMIAEMALAITQKACSEDIARFSHAHPTLSEGIREAALSITAKAIHV